MQFLPRVPSSLTKGAMYKLLRMTKEYSIALTFFGRI